MLPGMKKLTDIFAQKKKTFSLELFPPKTPKGYDKLMATISAMAELKPDFISCTYGAGGGNRDKTFDIAQHVQERHGIPAVAHLTCVLNTRAEIKAILEDIQKRGIRNILALRGDPPLEHPNWVPGEDHFHYSVDLCRFIREHFGYTFCIGVAGFPQGHPQAVSLEQDAQYLHKKIQNGADFIVTQFFFQNEDYFAYVRRLQALGVHARVIPGVLPITNYPRVVTFSEKDHIILDERLKSQFEPIAQDPEKTLEAGKTLAIEQARALLTGQAPGIHFYTLNKIQPLKDIFFNIKDLL